MFLNILHSVCTRNIFINIPKAKEPSQQIIIVKGNSFLCFNTSGAVDRIFF